MGFVVSDGAVRALSRPTAALPSRLSTGATLTMSVEYGEIWRKQPAVRTVVTFLARNIAQLGLHTFERVSDTERTRLHDHPLAVLLRRPNPWTTRYRFISALVHDLAIYDVAYLAKSVVDGRTAALLRLPPPAVRPAGDDWMSPDSFEVSGSRGKKTLPREQMVYFRGYSVFGDVGASPIEALRQVLLEDWSSSQMRDQVMRNGARLSGYITRPAGVSWSTEARDRFRTQWQQQYAADGIRAGGTPILEDGMTFEAASQSAKDLQYIEARKLTREEVASEYFIPPPMVGILDKASFSNITEQHKMLYQDTLGPWLTMIAEEIALQLVSDFEASTSAERFYVEFNLREKLTGSFIERQDAITKAVGGPTMTINEARALDNRPPIDGGDALIRPLNVTQNGDDEPVPAAAAGAGDTDDEQTDPDDDEED